MKITVREAARMLEVSEKTVYRWIRRKQLPVHRIHYRVSGATRDEALRNVVSLMRLPEEVDREYLYQMLLARETLGTTGVGDGIAIPHVRNAVVLHDGLLRLLGRISERPPGPRPGPAQGAGA